MVSAFGATLTVELGPSRFFSGASFMRVGAGEAVLDGCPSGVFDLGLSTVEATVDSAFSLFSSSRPKESFPFGTGFRFFFGGWPGVETLCFDH